MEPLLATIANYLLCVVGFLLVWVLRSLDATIKGIADDLREHIESDQNLFRVHAERISKLEGLTPPALRPWNSRK